MRPVEWIRKLLENRGLELADGRPLFQYRLTDTEFRDLLETLKLSSQFGVEHAKSMLSWDAAFVMYAAEWWRREYSGHWGWENIFSSIGIDYRELQVGARNDLVEAGLRRWRRKVRSSIGYRNFLGTIATEGGLPLKQLSGSDSGGWLRHVLQPVLRKHIEKGHSLAALIEAYSDFIPRSYRSAQLAEILKDIAEAIVALRDTHQLAGVETPLRLLDEKDPNWRDSFPLPVDDSAARSLLRDLVDTAARATTKAASAFPFECCRHLINAEYADPDLVSQIELPTFVTLQSVGLESLESLPSTMELEVFSPSGGSWPWCRAVLTTFQSRTALKLSGRNFRVVGLDAIKEIRVRLKSKGQRVADIEVRGGEPIDPQLPWLFRKVDEKWTLHGTATQSVRDQVALLYVPNDLQIAPEDESSSAEPLGAAFAGRIWRLTGNAACSNGADRFHMGSGGQETQTAYQLSGRRFPYLSVPPEVYIGAPRLYEWNTLTGMSRKHHDTRVLAKAVGRSAADWRPLSEIRPGVYQVRAVDPGNNVLFSRTIGILDANYGHDLAPDREEVRRGSIFFQGINGSELAVSSPGIRSSIDCEAAGTRLNLEAFSQPPKSIEVSLLATHQGRPMTLVLPFPSRGALLFDAADRLVSTTKTLNLQDLHGYRLKVFNDKRHLASRFSLTLSLVDRALSHADSRDIYVEVPLKLTDEYSELAIADWFSMIKTLFGVARSLDAVVQLKLALNSFTLLAVNVRRYEYTLTREISSGIVSIHSEDVGEVPSDVLEDAAVLALNLDHPDEEPVLLEPRRSEGVPVGSWDFAPWDRALGPWIIYPSPESHLQFRSLLWTVRHSEGYESDTLTQGNNLRAAIAVGDESLRRYAIAVALRAMADDHDHPDWQYMEALWLQTAHLPVVTFDIWLVALQVPAFLAALFVKSRRDILERLEDELPLIWELVPRADWELALNAYRRKLEDHLGDDDPDLADELLAKVIEQLSSHATSMLSMAAILNSTVRGVHSPELGLMGQPLALFLKPQMENFYQQLFRRQAEQDWPRLLHSELSRRHQSLPKTFQSIVKVQNTYQEPVVFLPFVLAWNAVVSGDGKLSESPSQIFKILQIKMFDEDWFNAAFQFLSGWLSQQEFGEAGHVAQ